MRISETKLHITWLSPQLYYSQLAWYKHKHQASNTQIPCAKYVIIINQKTIEIHAITSSIKYLSNHKLDVLKTIWGEKRLQRLKDITLHCHSASQASSPLQAIRISCPHSWIGKTSSLGRTTLFLLTPRLRLSFLAMRSFTLSK